MIWARTTGIPAAFGAAMAFGLASASAGTVLCPASLKTRQIAAVPPGFSAVRFSGEAPLLEVTFFDRDLGQAAALEPDEIRRFNDGTLVSTWTFPAGKWRPNLVRCAYWGTQVVLVKTLDPKIGICATTYDKAARIGGKPLIRKIDCK